MAQKPHFQLEELGSKLQSIPSDDNVLSELLKVCVSSNFSLLRFAIGFYLLREFRVFFNGNFEFLSLFLVLGVSCVVIFCLGSYGEEYGDDFSRLS